MANTTIWYGESGTAYTYTVFGLSGRWNDIGGNYIFAALHNEVWSAAYIGQTGSFENRIPNHPEMPCAQQHGATHVHAHTNKDQQARVDEEADLIAAHQPPCNQLLR